jgi:hypothetical protein
VRLYQDGEIMRHSLTFVRIMLLWVGLALAFPAVSSVGMATHPQTPDHDMSASSAVDPDKGPSELNHHIAGLFLIAIGLSLIVSDHFRSLAWLRWLPPVLFIAGGMFLAAWSDSEIWPRGALSWSWLVHHDAEARQHKLYALLLAVIGGVEAMKLVPRFRRPWLKAVFPVLGAIGGIALLFHSHGGEMVMVQPASASLIAPEHDHNAEGMATHGSDHKHGAAPANSVTKTGTSHSHEHVMSRTAVKIQREHAWFVVAGLFVALFKFVYDSARPPARISLHFWASSVMVLGCLLLMYTE